MFHCCLSRDACCYRTGFESLLFQELGTVMTPQGRGRGWDNGMRGAFCTELGLEVTLRQVGVPGSCHKLLASRKWALWELLRAGRDLASLLRPREVDNLTKAAQLVWRAELEIHSKSSKVSFRYSLDSPSGLHSP